MFDMTEKLIEWIEEEVDTRGWNFSELSRRSELSPGTISDVLSGRTQPGLRFCNGIASALGAPPERVFRMAGLLPPIIIGSETEKRQQECMEYFQYLPPEDQERLVGIARTFYERRSEYTVNKESDG